VSVQLEEGKALVYMYGDIQASRIACGNQVAALEKAGVELVYLAKQKEALHTLEKEIKNQLAKHLNGDSDILTRWALSICGIGEVAVASLQVHVDIAKLQTAGELWSFAGLNPSAEWKAKTKRPWNADLKRTCYLIGESFVKVHNREDDIYGHVWAERKLLENERNEEGRFADQAAKKLKQVGKNTEAYKHYSQGKLPPAHIHARAKRYAVKLFLSHYFEVGYTALHGERPNLPYAIAHKQHVHYIPPPGIEWVEEEVRSHQTRENHRPGASQERGENQMDRASHQTQEVER
jgi:hypothetical protein